MIAGSYDGTLSIWEITQKAQTQGKDDAANNGSTTIYPQFRSMIDNTKDNEIDITTESYEILCIYYFNFIRDQNDQKDGLEFNEPEQDMRMKDKNDDGETKGLKPDKDGYIIVGGNSKKIRVYKFKTGEFFCSMEGH